jgi:CPA2 family monovalent cation:H+ antiporter-2
MENGSDRGPGLTQIGEFSYVLVQVARDARLVGDDIYNATLAGSLVTILHNGLLMRFVPDGAKVRLQLKRWFDG